MEEKMKRAGDSNRITREYLDSLLIETRLLDADIPDTSVLLFGNEFSTPVMSAAFSHLSGYGNSAPAELAEGIMHAGALNWWGMGSDEEFSSILETEARTVRIVKPYADEQLTAEQICFAVEHGAVAVGMDIDHAFNHKGGYDCISGLEMRPVSLSRLKYYISIAGNTPFIVKGVLSIQDAVKCVEAGARAIMVSHHHGLMDYAVPPLMALPGIVKEVGTDVTVLADCGMDSGADVFKALASGARAVSVSRHILEHLKDGGSRAVTDRIQGMTWELKGFMARCGMKSLEQIDGSVLHRL